MIRFFNTLQIAVYEKSHTYFRFILKNNERNNVRKDSLIDFYNLGTTYLKREKYSKANEFFERAKQFENSETAPEAKVNLYYNSAYTFFKLGKLVKGCETLLEAVFLGDTASKTLFKTKCMNKEVTDE